MLDSESALERLDVVAVEGVEGEVMYKSGNDPTEDD